MSSESMKARMTHAVWTGTPSTLAAGSATSGPGPPAGAPGSTPGPVGTTEPQQPAALGPVGGGPPAPGVVTGGPVVASPGSWVAAAAAWLPPESDVETEGVRQR